MKNSNTKTVLALCLVALLGFFAGMMFKANSEKNEDKAAVLPMRNMNNKSSMLTANELIAPDLWRVAYDPLLTPVVAAVDPLPIAALATLPAIAPKVKTAVRDRDVQVVVELPGLKKQDVDLVVGKDTLAIKAELADASKVKNKGFATVQEAFDETIRLPCPVDPEKAKAAFKDGQLIVEMPKADANLAQSSNRNY